MLGDIITFFGEDPVRPVVDAAAAADWLLAFALNTSLAALCSFNRSSNDLLLPVTARLKERA